MLVKPVSVIVQPANADYVNALFPNAVATGLYSVPAPLEATAGISSVECVLRPPPITNFSVAASFAAGGGVGNPPRYHGGRPRPEPRPRASRAISRNYKSFEETIKSIPLYKNMLAKSGVLT